MEIITAIIIAIPLFVIAGALVDIKNAIKNKN